MNEEQNIFLIALYKNHFDGNGGMNWREWASEEGYEQSQIDAAFDNLDEQGLVDAASLGPYAEITSSGILYVEDNKLVSNEQIGVNQKFRTELLNALARVREEHGLHGMVDCQTICRENNLDELLFRSNESLMRDCGLMEFKTARCLTITSHGYATVIEWRARVDLVTKLSELGTSEITPQARGCEFEKLVEQAAKNESWRTDRNVRRPGEEIDVVISRELTYFIISCKWERNPIEVAAVRDLRERVTHRPGSNGLLFSMSGFSSGAEDYARERMESALILFFGPTDIENALGGGLSTLLDQKFNEAMTRRGMSYE